MLFLILVYHCCLLLPCTRRYFYPLITWLKRRMRRLPSGWQRNWHLVNFLASVISVHHLHLRSQFPTAVVQRGVVLASRWKILKPPNFLCFIPSIIWLYIYLFSIYLPAYLLNRSKIYLITWLFTTSFCYQFIHSCFIQFIFRRLKHYPHLFEMWFQKNSTVFLK